MTPLTPGYGETPVSDDEWDALLQSIRDVVGAPVRKAAVYDLEQAIQAEVAEALLTEVIYGSLVLDQLLTDSLLRDLHRRLYGDSWVWRGHTRRDSSGPPVH